jgi:hypothetical protein
MSLVMNFMAAKLKIFVIAVHPTSTFARASGSSRRSPPLVVIGVPWSLDQDRDNEDLEAHVSSQQQRTGE